MDIRREIGNFFSNLFNNFFGGFINSKALHLFLLGLVIGAILFVLLYFFVALRAVKANFTYGPEVNNTTEEEMVEMIKSKIVLYRDKEMRKLHGNGKWMTRVVKELIAEISLLYYPSSRNSIYELSIQEALDLSFHLSNRVDEILDKKIFRIVKKIRLAKIVHLLALAEEKAAMSKEQAERRGLLAFGKRLVNKVNPVTVAKKLIVDKGIDVAITKLSVEALKIIAEEAHGVYSKKLFDKEKIMSGITEEFED